LVVMAFVASGSPPHHVFELAAPMEPGLYRFRFSDEMLKLWEQEKLSNLRLFDAADNPMDCESIRSLPLQYVRRTYTLNGNWVDDQAAWNTPKQANFPFNSIWRFNVPSTAQDEFPLALHLTWHSTIDLPGEVQLVTTVSQSPPPRISLVDGQGYIDRRGLHVPIDGHVSLYVGGQHPQKPWPPTAELRFTLASDELTLDPPTLETATLRSWVREIPREPGWYVFHGNGKTPYRVQIGRDVESCSTLRSERDANIQDPNWPPEVTINRQILDSPRLGR